MDSCSPYFSPLPVIIKWGGKVNFLCRYVILNDLTLQQYTKCLTLIVNWISVLQFSIFKMMSCPLWVNQSPLKYSLWVVLIPNTVLWVYVKSYQWFVRFCSFPWIVSATTGVRHFNWCVPENCFQIYTFTHTVHIFTQLPSSWKEYSAFFYLMLLYHISLIFQAVLTVFSSGG